MRTIMSSNPWNEFQIEHGGEGLNRGEMSEMYHAERDADDSNAEASATIDTTDTVESITDRVDKLTVGTNSDVEPSDSTNQEDAEKKSNESAHDATTDSNPSETVIQDNDNDLSPTGNDVSEEVDVAPSTNENLTDDKEESSNNESDSGKSKLSVKDNPWNDFQNQNKGEGKTSTELSEMYRGQQKRQTEEEQQQPTEEEQQAQTKEDQQQTQEEQSEEQQRL